MPKGKKRGKYKKKPKKPKDPKTLRRSKDHLLDPDLFSRYDFDLRKSIHITLFKETKKEVDIIKIRLGLSFQEIYECFSQALITQDPYLIKMLNEFHARKRSAESEKLMSRTDVDSVYDMLDQESPLK